MIVSKPNFFLLTSGPGVGKTALIDHLRARGEHCVEETHRRVIRAEAAAGGTALPWRDAAAYRERTAREDIAIFDRLSQVEHRVFFDRGVLDSFPPPEAGLPPAWLAQAARRRRYNTHVLIPPPWEAIYRQDDERRQDFAEAQATHARILSLCEALGYQPVILPTTSVEERAAFVLDLVDQVSTKARSST